MSESWEFNKVLNRNRKRVSTSSLQFGAVEETDLKGSRLNKKKDELQLYSCSCSPFSIFIVSKNLVVNIQSESPSLRCGESKRKVSVKT